VLAGERRAPIIIRRLWRKANAIPVREVHLQVLIVMGMKAKPPH
jgi:hypothetical protein